MGSQGCIQIILKVSLVYLQTLHSLSQRIPLTSELCNLSTTCCQFVLSFLGGCLYPFLCLPQPGLLSKPKGQLEFVLHFFCFLLLSLQPR